MADLDKELNEVSAIEVEPPSCRRSGGRQRKPLPPTQLDADQTLHDLDFTGDYKKLFRDVAHAYGLECSYDSDYQPGNPFHFRMTGVDYRDAIHGLEAATGSFVVPLTPKLFLVVKDTAQKRHREIESPP